MSRTYTGPTHAIVSNESGCTYPVHSKRAISHDLILPPSNECLVSLFEDEPKYFGMERCEPKRNQDERDFIQLKPVHGSMHIYCPGSQLTIGGRTQPCPDEIFVLPITASFKINNDEYHGSQVHLDHVEKIDPLFTMKANWHLQPKVNLSVLRQHPLMTEEKHTHADDVDSTGLGWINHPNYWISFGCLFIIFILIIAFTALYFRMNKKIDVSIVNKPPRDDEPACESV